MCLQEETRTNFIQALKNGVVPATGCTEPIAVAFGAANCLAYLENKDIQKIEISVSLSVMKNAMAVIVPGTGKPGLLIAAATGAIAGDPTAGLNVIANLTDDDLPKINKLVESGKVSAKIAPVEDKLYVEVIATDKEDTVKVCIAGGHTNIFLIQKNDQVIFSKNRPAAYSVSESQEFLQTVKFKDVWNFAQTEPLENIFFIKDSANLNMALVDDGLTHSYGLNLGKSLKNSPLDSATDDFSNKLISYSSAASDARMGGSQLPAMTNSGSGNQGIAATVPICVTAKYVDASEEQLIRALTVSHLTALYIHAFLPVLSAYCAVDSAAMGAGVGCVYLLKNDYEMATASIKNMVGDVSGMVCDGAGCSCAMKVASSVSSMYRSMNLAIQGIVIPGSNGLVSDEVDTTIRGLGVLATDGLKETNPVILDIMMSK
ncbi:L-cysteine desulfidase family protein [Companilactobacillus kedongensis]|uniref:L-cysteine desulfidase family protein n=1 Tax=Companilactobacillus kedongensis TaxID=2486004 RepID=UPI000F7ACB4C|nr:L-serine ammonia-lyase, iron-sulfur-dependent, subunit alpha [Companilactobacillus kedongensis]